MGEGKRGPKDSDILAENRLLPLSPSIFLVLFLTLRPRTPHLILFLEEEGREINVAANIRTLGRLGKGDRSSTQFENNPGGLLPPSLCIYLPGTTIPAHSPPPWPASCPLRVLGNGCANLCRGDGGFCAGWASQEGGS